MILKRSAIPVLDWPVFTESQKSSKEQIKIKNNGDCFFFDIYGIVSLHWIPEAQTTNQHYYLHVIAKLREMIIKK